MTPRERGAELRRAVSYSVRNNCVFYFKTSKNRWVAEVEYRTQTPIIYRESEVEWTGTQNASVAFEVYFTPNQLDYNGCHVYNLEQKWRVDRKTYQWAVRKLSQHQVMQKMVQS